MGLKSVNSDLVFLKRLRSTYQFKVPVLRGILGESFGTQSIKTCYNLIQTKN